MAEVVFDLIVKFVCNFILAKNVEVASFKQRYYILRLVCRFNFSIFSILLATNLNNLLQNVYVFNSIRIFVE